MEIFFNRYPYTNKKISKQYKQQYIIMSRIQQIDSYLKSKKVKTDSPISLALLIELLDGFQPEVSPDLAKLFDEHADVWHVSDDLMPAGKAVSRDKFLSLPIWTEDDMYSAYCADERNSYSDFKEWLATLKRQ